MRTSLIVLLAFLWAVPSLVAQEQHIAGQQQIHDLITAQDEKQRADRAVVLETLQIPQVRELAEDLGVPLDRAEGAIQALQGEELARLAAQSRAVQDGLRGGQTFRISATIIIIALLVVILIVVAVD
jgi:hypothetical protein